MPTHTMRIKSRFFFHFQTRKIDIIDRQISARSTGAAAHARIPPIRCGFRRINQEILSNSPFERTTQTVVAFNLQELATQGAVSPFWDFKKTAGRAHSV
jgi:hypothetical protein